MNTSYFTQSETAEITNRQVFSIEQGIANGKISLEAIGEIMPGALMLHDMSALEITYMNNFGCDMLRHSLVEINQMGAGYYTKFFKEEETQIFVPAMMNFYQKKDTSAVFSFFHRVLTDGKSEYTWWYAVSKFLKDDKNNNSSLLLMANKVSGMGNLVNKFAKLLDENVYVTKNYKLFALLTKREKEIITHLANGKSTAQISEELYLSHHTISTHRKNINNKLGINSFSELLRFASAFELII